MLPYFFLGRWCGGHPTNLYQRFGHVWHKYRDISPPTSNFYKGSKSAIFGLIAQWVSTVSHLKIQMAYLNLSTPNICFTNPENPTIHAKMSRYLVQNFNQCNFGLFLPNRLPWQLPLLDEKLGIFEFADSQNPIIHAKISWCLVEN